MKLKPRDHLLYSAIFIEEKYGLMIEQQMQSAGHAFIHHQSSQFPCSTNYHDTFEFST